MASSNVKNNKPTFEKDYFHFNHYVVIILDMDYKKLFIYIVIVIAFLCIIGIKLFGFKDDVYTYLGVAQLNFKRDYVWKKECNGSAFQMIVNLTKQLEDARFLALSENSLVHKGNRSATYSDKSHSYIVLNAAKGVNYWSKIIRVTTINTVFLNCHLDCNPVTKSESAICKDLFSADTFDGAISNKL